MTLLHDATSSPGAEWDTAKDSTAAYQGPRSRNMIFGVNVSVKTDSSPVYVSSDIFITGTQGGEANSVERYQHDYMTMLPTPTIRWLPTRVTTAAPRLCSKYLSTIEGGLFR
jgi:hypothetical protein